MNLLVKSLRSLMSSSNMLPSLSPLAPFNVRGYNHLHVPCLDVQYFQQKHLDAERSGVHDNRYGVDRPSAVAGSVKSWMRWGVVALLFDVTRRLM